MMMKTMKDKNPLVNRIKELHESLNEHPVRSARYDFIASRELGLNFNSYIGILLTEINRLEKLMKNLEEQVNNLKEVVKNKGKETSILKKSVRELTERVLGLRTLKNILFNRNIELKRTINQLKINNRELKERLDSSYTERAKLLALLATFYPAILGKDRDTPEYSVLYLKLINGDQVSFHIHSRDKKYLNNVREEDNNEIACNIWDGHTTEIKWDRIMNEVEKRS
jgi:predicted RNase H-like nuclease (RuvC/YqgF family)